MKIQWSLSKADIIGTNIPALWKLFLLDFTLTYINQFVPWTTTRLFRIGNLHRGDYCKNNFRWDKWKHFCCLSWQKEALVRYLNLTYLYAVWKKNLQESNGFIVYCFFYITCKRNAIKIPTCRVSALFTIFILFFSKLQVVGNLKRK